MSDNNPLTYCYHCRLLVGPEHGISPDSGGYSLRATIAAQAEELERLKGIIRNLNTDLQNSTRLEDYQEECREREIADAKVVVLEAELAEKDKRIADLEDAVSELNNFDAPAELVQARAELAVLREQLDSYTIFHNGAEWVTAVVGDLPRFKTEDEAADASSTIQPPLQALSSMDDLESRIATLERENACPWNKEE